VYRILTLTIGLCSFSACAKSVPPRPTSSPSTEIPSADDEVQSEETVDEEMDTAPPPSKVQAVESRPSINSGGKTTMHIKVGLGSEHLLAVNVACGEFRVRRSIQNKEAVIPNIPLSSSQCKLKFSPGGAVYILQNYGGEALECTVINGNQASCK